MPDRTELAPHEITEISEAIADEVMNHLSSGKLNMSEVREALLEVAMECGVGHTDKHLIKMTVTRLKRRLEGGNNQPQPTQKQKLPTPDCSMSAVFFAAF